MQAKMGKYASKHALWSLSDKSYCAYLHAQVKTKCHTGTFYLLNDCSTLYYGVIYVSCCHMCFLPSYVFPALICVSCRHMCFLASYVFPGIICVSWRHMCFLASYVSWRHMCFLASYVFPGVICVSCCHVFPAIISNDVLKKNFGWCLYDL